MTTVSASLLQMPSGTFKMQIEILFRQAHTVHAAQPAERANVWLQLQRLKAIGTVPTNDGRVVFFFFFLLQS